MSEIKLYGYATSPYVRKTGCFLYYKELDFIHIPVNPIAPEATIGHTNSTKVPVLEIDGSGGTNHLRMRIGLMSCFLKNLYTPWSIEQK